MEQVAIGKVEQAAAEKRRDIHAGDRGAIFLDGFRIFRGGRHVELPGQTGDLDADGVRIARVFEAVAGAADVETRRSIATVRIVAPFSSIR